MIWRYGVENVVEIASILDGLSQYTRKLRNSLSREGQIAAIGSQQSCRFLVISQAFGLHPPQALKRQHFRRATCERLVHAKKDTDRRSDMSENVADILIDRLVDWDIRTIFTFPGDGINGIFEALRTRSQKIQLIQVRHEEAAAFAACGYAKFSRRLGVCLATSGPGGIHL